MKVLKVLFFALLICFCLKATADVGCYIPSTGNLYPEKVPGQPNYSKTPVIFMGAACTAGNTGSSTTCFVNGGVGNGFEGNYSPANCSIDQFAWFLLLAGGVAGYCFIMRRATIC